MGIIYKIANQRDKQAELNRLRELEQKEADRQERMDSTTLEECERLNQVLGWTALIKAGHLEVLGRL